MSVKEELLHIQSLDPEKILRAEAVLKWARSHKRSALHREIEWDVDAAALQYQLWQIRRIIALNIVSETGEPQVVSLSIDRVRPGGGYRSVSDVIRSKDLSAAMLKDALQELERVQVKYERVKELTEVWESVSRVRRRTTTIAGTHETRQSR